MKKFSVIGLGYVGLPVAVEFGKISEVIGFDINHRRLSELKAGFDRNNEIEHEELNSTNIKLSAQLETLMPQATTQVQTISHLTAALTSVEEKASENM